MQERMVNRILHSAYRFLNHGLVGNVLIHFQHRYIILLNRQLAPAINPIYPTCTLITTADMEAIVVMEVDIPTAAHI